MRIHDDEIQYDSSNNPIAVINNIDILVSYSSYDTTPLVLANVCKNYTNSVWTADSYYISDFYRTINALDDGEYAYYLNCNKCQELLFARYALSSNAAGDSILSCIDPNTYKTSIQGTFSYISPDIEEFERNPILSSVSIKFVDKIYVLSTYDLFSTLSDMY